MQSDNKTTLIEMIKNRTSKEDKILLGSIDLKKTNEEIILDLQKANIINFRGENEN